MRSRRKGHGEPHGPTLPLARAALLVGIVAGACDWSGPSVDRPSVSPGPSVVGAPSPSPFVAASGAPATSGTWGPLAVIPPQEGADTARNEGTLRITEACVVLLTRGGPVLLTLPADRTTWLQEDRSIAFANYDGSRVTAGDGELVVVGGSGDSVEESGVTAEAWLARTPWVSRPADSCPLESRWTVGALSR